MRKSTLNPSEMFVWLPDPGGMYVGYGIVLPDSQALLLYIAYPGENQPYSLRFGDIPESAQRLHNGEGLRGKIPEKLRFALNLVGAAAFRDAYHWQ